MVEGNWKAIATDIAAKIEAGEFPPGTRLPSGDRLAETLGVNRMAAHRAIGELQRLGLVVRQRGRGSVVATRHEKRRSRIALLVDGYSSFHRFPSGELLRGIQESIGEESTLIIADSKHDTALESRQLRRLARETDGILLYPTNLTKPATLCALLAEGTPVVILDRVPQGVAVDSVTTDNFGAVSGAVAMLAGRGHRNIGFLSFHKPEFSSVAERYRGYRAGLSDARLDCEHLVRWLPAGVDPSTPTFSQLVGDVLLALRSQSEPMTALFSVEDGIGCAAVTACEQLQIHLPEDLEVVTFNDWHPLTLRMPWNVHRLVQRKHELGQVAADLLLKRIASPNQAPRAEFVPADLICADAGLQGNYASLDYR